MTFVTGGKGGTTDCAVTIGGGAVTFVTDGVTGEMTDVATGATAVGEISLLVASSSSFNNVDNCER